MSLFDTTPRPALAGALVAGRRAAVDRSGGPESPAEVTDSTTSMSQWGAAVTIEVAPAAGAGATVRIRATALSRLAIQQPAPPGGGVLTQYAAGGAEVELAAVFPAAPSPAALSCLSWLVAVRAQLAALNARLQAERAQRATAAPPAAVAQRYLPEP